jgi:hypothetical protein
MEDITEKHKVRTTLSKEDFAVVQNFSRINPEWNLKFYVEEEDEHAVRVAIVFRNATKQEFHQRMIHFFIKAFKYKTI